MGLRAFRKQLTQISTTAVADQLTDELQDDFVIGWCPLPAGSTLNAVWMKVLAHTTTVNGQAVSSPVGMTGYILPVPDPDDPEVDPNTLWDKVVPKVQELDSTMLDLDTGSADVDGVIGFTEIDIESILDVTGIRRIFEWKDVLALNSPGVVADVVSGQYYPAFRKEGWIRRSYRVAVPSVALFAFTAIELPDDLNGFTGVMQEWAPDSAKNWIHLGRMRNTLEKALDYALGDTGGGIATLESVVRFLKQAYLQNDDTIQSKAWELVSRFTYDVTFPDDPTFNNISGGI